MSSICPKCNKEYSYWLEEFVKNLGKCEECAVKEKGLIKVDSHYVPWEYRHYLRPNGTTAEKKPEYYDDANAPLPLISWDEEFEKWKVEFSGAEAGIVGHEVVDLVWYFDSKEEIIEEMLKGGKK